MEGMGVKFTPGIGGCLLRHSSVFGPMAGTLGLIASPNVPYGWFSPPPASHPPAHPYNMPSAHPYNMPSVILERF